MYTVLIVEDEALVRIGLKSSIDWERLNMQVIADVPNGQAALEIYNKEKPDLILTDIKMPVMDGIQLISMIRKKDSGTKIIILTCYEEFDLAHKALQLGVSDYILKLKMSPKEIEEVLMKVSTELKKENAVHPQSPPVSVDSSVIKENLFKEYIFYSLYSEEKFSLTVEQMKLHLSPERLVLCVMHIDRFEVLQKKFEDKQGNLIRFAVINILDEILGGFNRGEAFHDKDERYVLIFSFADMVSEGRIYELLNEILVRINTVMESYIDSPVTFVISRPNTAYSSIRIMYGECMAILEQSYFLSEGKYIRCDSANTKNIKETIQKKLREFAEDLDVSIEDYYKEIISGTEALTNTAEITKSQLQKMFISWMHWSAIHLNINRSLVSKLVMEYAARVHSCATLDENMELFRQYLSEVQKLQSKTKYMSREVAEAVDYIRKNYRKDISLQEVAEKVEMSTSYFSSLFKKELELSFVEYLNQVRIDMAKDILLGTHLKSYEVAERVGFSDESYFSRMFKRYTGMRPNEFKKRLFVNIQEDAHAE